MSSSIELGTRATAKPTNKRNNTKWPNWFLPFYEPMVYGSYWPSLIKVESLASSHSVISNSNSVYFSVIWIYILSNLLWVSRSPVISNFSLLPLRIRDRGFNCYVKKESKFSSSQKLKWRMFKKMYRWSNAIQIQEDLFLSHHLFNKWWEWSLFFWSKRKFRNASFLPVSESPLSFLFALHANFQKKRFIKNILLTGT